MPQVAYVTCDVIMNCLLTGDSEWCEFIGCVCIIRCRAVPCGPTDWPSLIDQTGPQWCMMMPRTAGQLRSVSGSLVAIVVFIVALHLLLPPCAAKQGNPHVCHMRVVVASIRPRLLLNIFQNFDKHAYSNSIGVALVDYFTVLFHIFNHFDA